MENKKENDTKKDREQKIKEEQENVLLKYKKSENFGKTIKELEVIAKNNGFERLIIADDDGVGVGEVVLKEYAGDNKSFGDKIVFFQQDLNKFQVGEKSLKNIKDLFETDREFAIGGFSDIFKHEKQHTKGPAFEEMQKKIKEMEMAVDSFDEKTANIEDLRKKLEEIEQEHYSKEEKQTELQRVSAGYINLDEFIKSQARMQVVRDVIYYGLDYMEDVEYSELDLDEDHFGFIKDKFNKEGEVVEMYKKIADLMEKMRKNLVTEFKKKNQSQRKNKNGL